jgi:hypothetical protein
VKALAMIPRRGADREEVLEDRPGFDIRMRGMPPASDVVAPEVNRVILDEVDRCGHVEQVLERRAVIAGARQLGHMLVTRA